MIESTEEFKRLRESDIPEEYCRAAHEGADIQVWKCVLEKYPDMAFWVAQNKAVPIEVLEVLSKHPDPKVRGMVARKRKITESLMLAFATDSDPSIRNTLVNNGKVTERVLKILVNDSWQTVSECAAENLLALSKP